MVECADNTAKRARTAAFWCLVIVAVVVLLLLLYALMVVPGPSASGSSVGVAALGFAVPTTAVAAPTVAATYSNPATYSSKTPAAEPESTVGKPMRVQVREDLRPYIVTPMVTTVVPRDAADQDVSAFDHRLPEQPEPADVGSEPIYADDEPLPDVLADLTETPADSLDDVLSLADLP